MKLRQVKKFLWLPKSLPHSGGYGRSWKWLCFVTVDQLLHDLEGSSWVDIAWGIAGRKVGLTPGMSLATLSLVRKLWGVLRGRLHVYQYERPAITTDAIVLSANSKDMLLIRRRNDPYKGQLALPGGYLNIGERTRDGMFRELREETGLDVGDVESVSLYAGLADTIDRDPRGRTISVAYAMRLKSDDAKGKVAAADDATLCEWVSLDDVIQNKLDLAFDHAAIVKGMPFLC